MTTLSFTQDEKDTINRLVKLEISVLEETRFAHEREVTVNKQNQNPKLDNDEEKQSQRDLLIQQHSKIVELLTKDLITLEQIKEKLA